MHIPSPCLIIDNAPEEETQQQQQQQNSSRMAL